MKKAPETLFHGRFRGLFRGASISSPTSPLACAMLDRPMAIQRFFRGDIPLCIPVEARPWSLNHSPLEGESGESARQGRSPRILPVGGRRLFGLTRRRERIGLVAGRGREPMRHGLQREHSGTRLHPVIPAQHALESFNRGRESSHGLLVSAPFPGRFAPEFPGIPGHSQ